MPNDPVAATDKPCPRPSSLTESERAALYRLLPDSPLAANVLAAMKAPARSSVVDHNALLARELIAWNRDGPYLTGIGRMVAAIKLRDDAIELKVQGALFAPRQYRPSGYTVPQSTW